MKPLIIANWKANKTISEASSWIEKTKAPLSSLEKVQVVVCGSFVTLPLLNNLFSGTTIKVGAQNVSHLGQGAFTGEVSAEMLQGLVEYCIVGHSERRKYFAETDQMIVKKVEFLLEKKIIPVLCAANLEQLESYLKESVVIREKAEEIVFVYEPPSAISGGGDYHPETPETADQVCKNFKEQLGKEVVTIYGGSVNPENSKNFLSMTNIHGALPGQASLEEQTFVRLVSGASEAVI